MLKVFCIGVIAVFLISCTEKNKTYKTEEANHNGFLVTTPHGNEFILNNSNGRQDSIKFIIQKFIEEDNKQSKDKLVYKLIISKRYSFTRLTMYSIKSFDGLDISHAVPYGFMLLNGHIVLIYSGIESLTQSDSNFNKELLAKLKPKLVEHPVIYNPKILQIDIKSDSIHVNNPVIDPYDFGELKKTDLFKVK